VGRVLLLLALRLLKPMQKVLPCRHLLPRLLLTAADLRDPTRLLLTGSSSTAVLHTLLCSSFQGCTAVV
jgi:hypothetical protein